MKDLIPVLIDDRYGERGKASCPWCRFVSHPVSFFLPSSKNITEQKIKRNDTNNNNRKIK